MQYANALADNYFSGDSALNHKAVNVKSGIKINLTLVNRCLAIILAVGFVAYLIGISDLTAKSFVLKDLKIKIADLAAQNQDLETKITVLNSYQYLSQKVVDLHFVPAGAVSYLPAANEALAKK